MYFAYLFVWLVPCLSNLPSVKSLESLALAVRQQPLVGLRTLIFWWQGSPAKLWLRLTLKNDAKPWTIGDFTMKNRGFTYFYYIYSMNNGCGFVRKTAVLEQRSWLSNLDLVLTTATNRNRNKQCPRNGMGWGAPGSRQASGPFKYPKFSCFCQAINRCFVESGYPKLSIWAPLLKVTILDDFGVLHFKNPQLSFLPIAHAPSMSNMRSLAQRSMDNWSHT